MTFCSVQVRPESVDLLKAMLARLISLMKTLPALSIANSGSEKPELGSPDDRSALIGVRGLKFHVSPSSSLQYW
ncbi:MAG: hypothetical protein KY437_01340 [Actinobacteria bacterium]|nr:hypothetical protein [Actinomycetota bacterium]